MGLKASALCFIFMLCFMVALPPIYACGYCGPLPPHYRPNPPKQGPPGSGNPPSHGGGHGHPKVPSPHKKPPKPPVVGPPVVRPPPVVFPPIVNPPVILPPPVVNPPVVLPPPGSGGGGGGGSTSPPFVTPPTTNPTCPINALKLGACVDVLGGLVHIGLGNPVENVCCPLIQGLLDLEAAICLCTTIRIKLLNLNIFIPLALQVIATCGKTPPPGFVCPPLL